jgi:hypothetical protein
VSFIRENYLQMHFGTLDPSNILCAHGSENITNGRKQQYIWDGRRVEVIVLLNNENAVSVNSMY